MSIQTVEIALPTGIDSVSVGLAEPIAIVEIRQGPSGPAGSAVIDAATQSDGTADLDLLNVDTVSAIVTGTLTASHIHGNLAGNVYGHVRAGENLAKGDPVYVSGSHGSGAELIPIVSKADASNAAKMPAIGIMDAAVALNANGHMVITGTIAQLNTAGYSVNAELYVAADGGLTATPPTARAQPVARVERANINEGAVIVKVNGLSASDATGNTLVRRTSTGGASFGPMTTGPLSATAISSDTHSITSSAGTTITGPLTLSGSGSNTLSATYSNTISLTGTTGVTIAGGPLTVNSSSATFAAGTITTSQPLTLTQTWNNVATTFKALDLNVTNTASNTASLLMDLRVGGVSRLSLRSVGNELLTVSAANTSSSYLQTVLRCVSGDGGVTQFAVMGSGNPRGVFVGANCGYGFANISTSSASADNVDLYVFRDAANTLAQRNGTAAQVSRVYDTYTSATDYHRLAIATARATATAMSGASVTLTNIIPAGAVVVGVTCKVTTAITGATSFDLGTAGDVDRFGAAIAVALGTTSDNRNWTSGTVECFPSATSLVLTANGSNFTAGAVYVSVQYLSGQAD